MVGPAALLLKQPQGWNFDVGHRFIALRVVRPDKSLYFRFTVRRFTRAMDFDMNWWGLIVVPLGVAICFGPVLVAWAMAGRKDRATAPPRSDQKDRH